VNPDAPRAFSSLSGKVAIVTGGTRGLGLRIAATLVKAGAQVVITGRDPDALATATAVLDPTGDAAVGIDCDIRDELAVANLVSGARARFGRIDLLVNNSGIAGPTAPLWETPTQQWLDTITTNVIGTFLCCRAVLPTMIGQRRGSIVTIGSMTGKRPLYGRTGYASSKTALIGLTRTLAMEAGPYGVRVNLVSPGPLEGERIQRVFDAQAATRGISAEDARREMVSESPLARLVPPDDVASVVAFLASDASASITGEDLNVSAGIVMY
jgi:NAD(P)-dependent dehydrogenase (short-subunit alcohol dehydrogenase family)